MKLVFIFWAIIGTIEVIRTLKMIFDSKKEFESQKQSGMDEETKRKLQIVEGILGKYMGVAIFFAMIYVFIASPYFIACRFYNLIFKKKKKNEQN